ncbi:hypothetical protein F4677DRAFT_342329 [Hypoxylon crocopeplum]|nr:hypothetical protein F4677DRAFT_342329 [Hypoxylon crocopeplum]
MDTLKKFAGKSETTGTSNNAQQPGEKQDVGDKIAGFVNKREGGKMSNQQLETGTDKARNMYEKATGNKVDPRISN